MSKTKQPDQQPGNGHDSPRDRLRAKIFHSKNKRFERKLISLFGAEVEIRQPSLGMILNAKSHDDTKQAAIELLVSYCFVPGTDERVFEDTDQDVLLEMPFGDDMMRVNEAIGELTNIDIVGAEKNFETTQVRTTP